jgi:hypothetical protein
MSEVILVRAVQTCPAAPSQWDAWDLDGRYWYLRYRSGHGGMGRGYGYADERFSFEAEPGEPESEIGLGDFLDRVGVSWKPELAGRITAWEVQP